MKIINRFDKAILFIIPGLVGFIMFYILPFGYSVGYAFLDKPINGSFIGFKNFIDLFNNKPYLLGLRNTFIFIGLSVPLNLILSLLVSLLIGRVGKNKDIYILIFLIPLVIPSGSMVFFWQSFFSYDGYLNYLLNFFDKDKINWIETNIVRYVVILIFIWKNLGYNMVLFIAGLHNIPKEYYEAAAVDGAGALRTFFNITLIYLLPTFVLVTIMSVINSFKVFKEVYLITGSYPNENIYMLQHFMNNMFNSLNYQKLTTATCILVLLITFFTQGLLKLEKKVSE